MSSFDYSNPILQFNTHKHSLLNYSSKKINSPFMKYQFSKEIFAIRSKSLSRKSSAMGSRSISYSTTLNNNKASEYFSKQDQFENNNIPFNNKIIQQFKPINNKRKRNVSRQSLTQYEESSKESKMIIVNII